MAPLNTWKTYAFVILCHYVGAHTLENDPTNSTVHPAIVFVEGGKNPSKANLFGEKSMMYFGNFQIGETFCILIVIQNLACVPFH